MAERYTQLFRLPDDLYTEGCPVLITAGALLKDNQTGAILAQMKFRSLSNQHIKALKVVIQPRDTVGRPLGVPVPFTYLDLNADRDETFGQKVPIRLPDPETRAYSVTVTETALWDNRVLTGDTEAEPLPRQQTLEETLKDPELVKQYVLRFGERCLYQLLEDEDLWQCTCGAVNRADEAVCHVCRASLNEMRTLDLAKLAEERDQRLAEERRAEEERLAAEQRERERLAARRKKLGKILAILIPAAALCAAAVLLTLKWFIPNGRYKAAEALYTAGEYRAAAQSFSELGDFKDSAARAEQAVLNGEKMEQAVELLTSGEYDRGYAMLEEMGRHDFVFASLKERGNALLAEEDFDGAYALYEQANDTESIFSSKLSRAETALSEGDRDTAKTLLTGLNYRNSEELLAEIRAEEEAEEAAALAAARAEAEAAQAASQAQAEAEAAQGAQTESAQTVSTLPLTAAATVGDHVQFGTYEQDADETNGAEPIEWLVLDRDGEKTLLLSRYVLDCQPYGKAIVGTRWGNSTLREWLNNTFYYAAFNDYERGAVSVSAITTSYATESYIAGRGSYTKTETEDSKDRIFVLNNKMAEEKRALIPMAALPTASAVANGCYVNGDNGCGCWWLRDTDYYGAAMGFVDSDGKIWKAGRLLDSPSTGVRPAMWVDVSKIVGGPLESADPDGSLFWTLNDGVLTISGQGAMPDFTNVQELPWGTDIKSVVVEKGVTGIGNSAFENCFGLASVTLPEGLTSIGNSAFNDCVSLQSITLPESLTSIGNGAFYGCYRLTSVTLPEGLTSIGDYSFYGCSPLKSITIPESVTSIGNAAFFGCLGLRTVTLPEGLTSIGDRAFSGCSALGTVYFGGTEEQWNAMQIGKDNAPLLNAEIVFQGE